MSKKVLFLYKTFFILFLSSVGLASNTLTTNSLLEKIQNTYQIFENTILLNGVSAYEALKLGGIQDDDIDLAIKNCANHSIKKHVVNVDDAVKDRKDSVFVHFGNFDLENTLKQIIKNKYSILAIEETPQKEKVIVLYAKLVLSH